MPSARRGEQNVAREAQLRWQGPPRPETRPPRRHPAARRLPSHAALPGAGLAACVCHRVPTPLLFTPAVQAKVVLWGSQQPAACDSSVMKMDYRQLRKYIKRCGGGWGEEVGEEVGGFLTIQCRRRGGRDRARYKSGTRGAGAEYGMPSPAAPAPCPTVLCEYIVCRCGKRFSTTADGDPRRSGRQCLPCSACRMPVSTFVPAAHAGCCRELTAVGISREPSEEDYRYLANRAGFVTSATGVRAASASLQELAAFKEWFDG